MPKILLSFVLGGLTAGVLAWLVLTFPQSPLSETQGPARQMDRAKAGPRETVRSSAGQDSDADGPGPVQTDQEPAGVPAGRALDEPSAASAGQGSVKKGPSTAQGWFERGLDLNDDSEQELHCYLKALELDPQFAPAFYRIGALQMRNGEFARARQAFAAFWIHASDQEKQEYHLSLYTSLDELSREIALLKGEPVDQAPGERSQVAFESNQGHIIVPVLLNQNTAARMILDTGAAITVISHELAREMGVRLNGTIRLTTIADGNLVARLGTLGSMGIGDRRMRNVRVAVVDFGQLEQKGVDGLVGMDVLRKTGMSIDHDRGIVELQ